MISTRAARRQRRRRWRRLARSDRGLGPLVARLAHRTCPLDLAVVGRDSGGKRKNRIHTNVAQADDDRDEHEDEVELEDRVDEEQPEHRERRPQQPLLERHERRVAVQPAHLDVVEDDRADEQHERRDRDRIEEVREVLRAEASLGEAGPRSAPGSSAGEDSSGPPAAATTGCRRRYAVTASSGAPSCQPTREGDRVRALLSVADRAASATSRASCSSWASRSSPPTARARRSRPTGSRSRPISDLTADAAARRRPGQDVPPADLRRHPGAPPGAAPTWPASTSTASA